MAKEFRFQDPGEGIREAEVLEVLVSEGDRVEAGQNVLRVETDKASFDVSSAFTGTVEEVRVSEGDVIHVGDVLLTVDTGEAAEEPEAAGAERAEAAPRDADEAREEAPEAGEGDEARQPDGGAEEEEPPPPRRKAGRAPGGARAGRGRGARDEGPVPASPATRRVARELGVDLREVEPSGEEGRVLTDDVRAHAERAGAAREERPARPREGRGAPREPAALPDFSRFGPVRREPLRSVRRTTARRMARSWAEIPHVTHNDLADITELEAFRRRHAAEIEEAGGKLTLTVLAMKAVAGVLQEHPRFNASLDVEAEEIVYKDYHHVGVALDSERGLLVPVIRDVDRKSLRELAVELTELADRVRAGEVTREDMTGSSFTITNVGPMGGTTFTPIINHPEVAILGMGRARLQPVVRGSLDAPEIVPRLLLPLSLGFDHRVNDGADAARFVNRLIELLSDPETFALSV